MSTATDLRAWTSFDAASQQTLLAGGTVTGGDGRKFVLVNGHATVVGSATYLTAHPSAPAPATSTATALASPARDKGGWMTLSTGAGVVTVPTQADPNAADKDAQNRNALALIKATLAQYGLPDSLADWAWTEIVAGKGQAEILLDLYQRPEFKTEFPEIDARQKAGLAPLSPGEIVSYRQQARQLMRNAGLPEGFYDSKSDFTGFLTKDVSLSELGQRITDAAQAAYNTPQQDKEEWQRLGFGHGDLTAMFLNPDVAQPLLHKQLAAASLAGTSVRAGYGQLNADQALGLTELGVSQQQAQQGFGNLAHQSELFGSLNSGEQQIGQPDQLAAQFGGNAAAQQRILDRARGRVAAFSSGGNFAGSQGGISGLGAAQR